ncbi:MAG: hypothetical protein AB1714_18575 [Acidobacteriota bacterium]
MLKADAGRLLDSASTDDKAQTQLLVDAMGLLGYTAANASFKDIRLDPRFFLDVASRARFPFVSTNVVDSRTLLPHFRACHVAAVDGRYKVAFLGVSQKNSSQARLPGGSSLVAVDPIEAAAKQVKELRPQVHLIVVLASLPRDEAERMAAQVDGIDMILGCDGSFATLDRPDFVNGTLVLYAGDQGKYVGKVDAYPSGDVVDRLVCKVVSLDQSLGDDPQMTALLDQWQQGSTKAQMPGPGISGVEAGGPETQRK